MTASMLFFSSQMITSMSSSCQKTTPIIYGTLPSSQMLTAMLSSSQSNPKGKGNLIIEPDDNIALII
jgi:hypothetical protein